MVQTRTDAFEVGKSRAIWPELESLERKHWRARVRSKICVIVRTHVRGIFWAIILTVVSESAIRCPYSVSFNLVFRNFEIGNKCPPKAVFDRSLLKLRGKAADWGKERGQKVVSKQCLMCQVGTEEVRVGLKIVVIQWLAST